jgi:hypothetical protein
MCFRAVSPVKAPGWCSGPVLRSAHMLRRFYALPVFQRKLVLCALVLQTAVVLLLAAFSFRRVRGLLALVSRFRVSPISGMSGIIRNEHVVRAVKASSRCLGRESTCLTQALTAAVLLRRLGTPASVAIGVRRPEDHVLTAHAWVESCGSIVYGAAEEFTVLTMLEQA